MTVISLFFFQMTYKQCGVFSYLDSHDATTKSTPKKYFKKYIKKRKKNRVTQKFQKYIFIKKSKRKTNEKRGKARRENINIYYDSFCFMYTRVEVYVWVIYYIDSKKDWQLIMRIIQLTNFFCLFILFS